MRQQTATLRFLRPAPPYWEVHCTLEQAPAPGQFVLADLGGPLREPLFPVADSGTDGYTFVTVVPPDHCITRLLPGAEISLLGPAGRGFRVQEVTRLLLIAEAAYLPFLAPLLAAAPSVAVMVEAPTRARLPRLDRFAPHIELSLVTLDGSAGYLGPLDGEGGDTSRAAEHLASLLVWAERVCVALNPTRYPRLASRLRAVRFYPQADFAQAWVPARLVCGVGVCQICRTRTAQGSRRICVEGPVLDLLDFETR